MEGENKEEVREGKRIEYQISDTERIARKCLTSQQGDHFRKELQYQKCGFGTKTGQHRREEKVQKQNLVICKNLINKFYLWKKIYK